MFQIIQINRKHESPIHILVQKAKISLRCTCTVQYFSLLSLLLILL